MRPYAFLALPCPRVFAGSWEFFHGKPIDCRGSHVDYSIGPAKSQRSMNSRLPICGVFWHWVSTCQRGFVRFLIPIIFRMLCQFWVPKKLLCQWSFPSRGCLKYHNIWLAVYLFFSCGWMWCVERAGRQLFEEEDNAFTDGDHSHCLFTAHGTLALRSHDTLWVIKDMLIKSLRTPQIIQYFELSGVIISD